jgi:hypothetical protein
VCGEAFCELLQDNEYCNDTGMNVNILSNSKENASSDDEDNVGDNSDMQHGTCTKLGSE